MTTPNPEAAGHAAEAAGYGEKTSGGMPQLDITTFPNQIFWLTVSLVIIYLILSRIVLPRIESVLSERQGTITGDLSAAEELKQKAVEAEDAYKKALADARTEANRIIAETKAEIQADLDAAIAKADAEIAAKSARSEKAIAEIRASAQDAIKEVAKDTAKEIVATFGVKADAKAISAAISQRMKG